MKLIIDIPEEVYKLGTLGLYFDCYSMKLHDTILSGTPISDNATNGDKKARSCDNCTHDVEEYFNKYCRNCVKFSQYESNQIKKNCFTCGKEPCLGRQDDPQIPCNEWIAK